MKDRKIMGMAKTRNKGKESSLSVEYDFHIMKMQKRIEMIDYVNHN